jgi:hypothetical protein
MSPVSAAAAEMPPNGTISSPFPPMLQPRLEMWRAGQATEETVEKATILSEGYANRGKGREELDRRYRKIGISAVAAAVRYQGQTKAETRTRDDDQVSAGSAA